MYKALYGLLCMAYANILRELLKEAINDKKKEWDDWTLKLLDQLFNYEG